MDDPLIDSLLRAVAAQPEDVELRVHLAQQLADRGRVDEAVAQAGAVLSAQPTHPGALAVIREATARTTPPSSPPPRQGEATLGAAAANGSSQADPAPRDVPADDGGELVEPAEPVGFDWGAAEAQVDDIVGPQFVDGEEPLAPDGPPVGNLAGTDETVRLSDVAGLEDVKERLQMAFLGPLSNPDLARLYGATGRGGLLLYGPPGCGKTFVARALAGEIGASFLSVSVADVLDMWVGSSERNVHELFAFARRNQPCVIFLDEVDALGLKRSQSRNMAIRGATNQLLLELDGAGSANDGVFVLAATNTPWDVDEALRRPGRLDRTVFVPPPDARARAAIFRTNLSNRPVENIDLADLARRSSGLSGADIAHVVSTAAERTMAVALRDGRPVMVDMSALDAALSEVKPSVGPWFETARTVVQFGNRDGSFDELATWMRRNKP